MFLLPCVFVAVRVYEPTPCLRQLYPINSEVSESKPVCVYNCQEHVSIQPEIEGEGILLYCIVGGVLLYCTVGGYTTVLNCR